MTKANAMIRRVARLCPIRLCLNAINRGVLSIPKLSVNITTLNTAIHNAKVNFSCRPMTEPSVVNGERLVGWSVFRVVNIFLW